jgi:hypothetical protein
VVEQTAVRKNRHGIDTFLKVGYIFAYQGLAQQHAVLIHL